MSKSKIWSHEKFWDEIKLLRSYQNALLAYFEQEILVGQKKSTNFLHMFFQFSCKVFFVGNSSLLDDPASRIRTIHSIESSFSSEVKLSGRPGLHSNDSLRAGGPLFLYHIGLNPWMANKRRTEAHVEKHSNAIP